MNRNRDNLIEEALRRYDQRSDFEVFLASHPEIREEVRELVHVGKYIERIAANVPVPQEGLKRALQKITANKETIAQTSKATGLVPTPYWGTSYVHVGVPILLLLIVMLGALRYQGISYVAVTREEGTSQDPMNMKAVPASEVGEKGASLMNQSGPLPPTGSIDDLVKALHEDAAAEFAAATLGDENFALATDDTADLNDFLNAYDENQI